MNDSLLTLITLILLVILDLVVAATRVSFFQSGLAAWRPAASTAGKKSKQVNAVLNHLPRLQASLNLAQNATRFLLAGVILLWSDTQPAALTPWAVLGILLLAALVVFWLEWAVRAAVLRSPYQWALRTLPVARLLEPGPGPICPAGDALVWQDSAHRGRSRG